MLSVQIQPVFLPSFQHLMPSVFHQLPLNQIETTLSECLLQSLLLLHQQMSVEEVEEVEGGGGGCGGGVGW